MFLGVTEPKHLAYMVRLGLWGPGTSFPLGIQDFLSAVVSGGVGMMELVAMHLKREGCYISRSLSYSGCTFDTVEDAVSAEALAVYDRAVKLWQELHQELVDGLQKGTIRFPLPKGGAGLDGADAGSEEGDEEEDDGIDLADYSSDDQDVGIGNSGKFMSPLKGNKKTGVTRAFVFRYYWGAHQRFFRSLCISLKVPCAVALAKKALEDGKSVIIGLQTTGESSIESEMGGGGGKGVEKGGGSTVTEIISAPALTMKKVVFKLLPLPPKPERVRRAEELRREERVERKKREATEKAQQRSKALFTAKGIAAKRSGIPIDLLSDDDDEGDVENEEEDIWVTKKREKLKKKLKAQRAVGRTESKDKEEEEGEEDAKDHAGNRARARRARAAVNYKEISDDDEEEEEELDFLKSEPVLEQSEEEEDEEKDDQVEEVSRGRNSKRAVPKARGKATGKAGRGDGKVTVQKMKKFSKYQSMLPDHEGWLFDVGCDEHIYARVRRFFPRHGSSDGTIIAYLPAEDNEGVAL
eukprot:gene3702-4618_t